MRKTGVFLIVVGMACGGMVSAQANDGRLQGTVGPHEFDVAVQCEIGQMGSTRLINARTDGVMRPLVDTNGDGIAGTVDAMGDQVTVQMTFGDDLYKFGGREKVVFRDDGFTWRETLERFDSDRAATHLKAGGKFSELESERVFEVEIDLSCSR